MGLYLNLNAGNGGKGTMLYTVAHELSHFVRQWSPAKFKVLANFLMERYGEKGVSVSDLVRRQMDKAKRSGLTLTFDEAYEEVVADSMEAMLTDGNVVQMMADLKQQDRTLWEKIRQWFQDLAAELKAVVEAYKGHRPDSPEGRMVADMQDVIVILESLYADALQDAGANYQAAGAEKNTTREGDVKYSFAGINAETSDHAALDRAKEMQKQGVSNDVIRQETGWFVGMDGKWRFEVDDSTAHVAENRINYMTLGELLPGAEIFRAYPEMKSISVVFQSLEPGVNAQYNRQFDHIDVSYRLKNDPDGIRSVVLHEIQHAIQNREGFTQGSTVGRWEKKIKDGFDARKGSDIREAREAEQKIAEFREKYPQLYRDLMELEAMAPDLPRGAMNWDTLEQIEEDPPEWQAYDARRDELEEIYGDKMWEFNSALYDLQRINKHPVRTAEELYFDTAGEIEARNVSGRRNLTAEERKNTPPILGGEDTVFADGDESADAYIPGTVSEGEIRSNIDAIAGMSSVTKIKADEFKMGDGRLLKDVTAFFESIGGSVYNERLGDVYLRKRGVRHDLAHGMSDEKATSFAAIPDVLRHGKVAGFVKNKDNKGYDSATVVAPIEIGEVPYMMGVIVHRSNNENTFYVHDVFCIKEEAAPLITGTHKVGETGGTASTISIIRRILDVKEKLSLKEKFSLRDSDGRELTKEQQAYFRNSKARDAQGRLLVLYHQTDGDFTVFDTRHPGAGSRDSDTPFGIFMKRASGDIGLSGKKQMALYANITNPLRAENREDLIRQLRDISASYADISDKHKRLDSEYHDKFEQAKNAWRDYIAQWRASNPDAKRSALYDDPKFNELFEAEDTVIKEWTSAADRLSAQAKEAITEDLRKAGYDGIFLENDVGSWGRKTDAIIALNPEQVKNTDNTQPTTDPDIRYSLRDEQVEKAAEAVREENEKLKEDVQRLRELLKLQRQVTGGTKFTASSVERAAKYLKQSAGVKGNTAEFGKLLNMFYESVAQDR